MTDAEIDDMVDRVEQGSLSAVARSLRRDGSLQPPTMHMFVSTHLGGYVGYVQSRPFYRGPDARSAISQMGFLPAAMYATRVVVTWEHVDLLVALSQREQAGRAMNAQVVLDARRDGTHVLRVHPLEMVVLDESKGLESPVLARWSTARRLEDGPLPGPMGELLGLWREGIDPRELPAILDQLDRAGYAVELGTTDR